MQIKTILGASIQDALAEARALLGDDVVLLESAPARDGAPARITVMVDVAPAAVAAPAPLAPADAAPMLFGYAAAGAARPSAPAVSSVPYGTEALHARPAEAPLSDAQLAALFSTPAPAPAPAYVAPTYALPVPEAPTAPALDADAFADALEARLASRFEALTDRLLTLERRVAETAAASVGEWAGHPVHAALLRGGLSPATTAGLFRAAASRGLRTESDPDALRWALAGALRDRLAPTAPPRHASQALVVVGPAGAGKTSLLLKLAADPRYFGNRRPAVLVVAPEAGGTAADPTPLYHQHGLAVRTVSTPEEVRAALDMTRDFDGLLIDTPALPSDPAAAREALERLRTLMAGIAPLEVVLVLDAARAAAPLTARDLDGLGLVPTAAALTRLDETTGWGRAAEWLLDLALPVPFAVTGPERVGALAPFTPGWLAEALVRQWADTPGTPA